MSKFPSQSSVVEAILAGMREAQKNFLFWTNNRLSLSAGPQKILSIHVAQAISAIENAPEVFIDATVSDILRCSLPNRKAFKTYMEKNAISQDVFSITLDERLLHHNHNDSISRVIITLKNGVCNAKAEYSYEIERLCKMLFKKTEESSSLDYGVFAFYSDLSTTARKKLIKRLPDIIESFDEVVSHFPSLKASFVQTPITEVIDVGEWMAGCYIVEPKT